MKLSIDNIKVAYYIKVVAYASPHTYTNPIDNIKVAYYIIKVAYYIDNIKVAYYIKVVAYASPHTYTNPYCDTHTLKPTHTHDRRWTIGKQTAGGVITPPTPGLSCYYSYYSYYYYYFCYNYHHHHLFFMIMMLGMAEVRVGEDWRLGRPQSMAIIMAMAYELTPDLFGSASLFYPLWESIIITMIFRIIKPSPTHTHTHTHPRAHTLTDTHAHTQVRPTSELTGATTCPKRFLWRRRVGLVRSAYR